MMSSTFEVHCGSVTGRWTSGARQAGGRVFAIGRLCWEGGLKRADGLLKRDSIEKHQTSSKEDSKLEKYSDYKPCETNFATVSYIYILYSFMRVELGEKS